MSEGRPRYNALGYPGGLAGDFGGLLVRWQNALVQIRAYQPGDMEACVAVLRSNVPLHFPASDEAEFRAFFADLPGPYFVVAAGDGAVVACGGIALEDVSDCAQLTGGHLQRHGKLELGFAP